MEQISYIVVNGERYPVENGTNVNINGRVYTIDELLEVAQNAQSQSESDSESEQQTGETTQSESPYPDVSYLVLNGDKYSIDDVQATTDLQKLQASIANQYNAELTYSVGDYCLHDGTLYVCTYDIDVPEEWNDSHWQTILVTDTGSTDVFELIATPTDETLTEFTANCTYEQFYDAAITKNQVIRIRINGVDGFSSIATSIAEHSGSIYFTIYSVDLETIIGVSTDTTSFRYSFVFYSNGVISMSNLQKEYLLYSDTATVYCNIYQDSKQGEIITSVEELLYWQDSDTERNNIKNIVADVIIYDNGEESRVVIPCLYRPSDFNISFTYVYNNVMYKANGTLSMQSVEHAPITIERQDANVPVSAGISVDGLISFYDFENTPLFTVQLPLYDGSVS